METRLIDLGPLPDGAVVWDVGAYNGDWSVEMLTAYPKADVTTFEPVSEYAAICEDRGLKVARMGLSGAAGSAQVTIAGDRSSTYEMGHAGTGQETIFLADVAIELADRKVDVMKVNVEGAEYPILERLLQTGKMPQIDHLLVQFHTFIPNFGERYLAIKKGMLKTHNLAWRTPFVWERWDRRPT